MLRTMPGDRIAQVVAILRRARAAGRRIFLFGNGGSAATASHFACDLAKLTRREGQPDFKVIALTDNLPIFSAYANDNGYETVFAEPLKSLAEPGDVAIGLSTSGQSANVLRALEAARALGLTTIGFTGYDGGALKDKVEVCVIVPARHVGQIEDAHHVLQHAICRALTIE
ncbi:MAG: SIS domain-containing protein [Chloroflexi bacterium]|nr:SIS domain-containing protein [Chloroflexota bacterium]